jgi:hypothetical protein
VIARAFSLVFFLLLAIACGPTTLPDLRIEGESETKKLAFELRALETKEDLQRAAPKLRKKFNRLAEILIKVSRFSKEAAEPSFASEQLFVELARLYEIPGGREIIEKAQLEAVQKLKKDLSR